MLTELDRHGPTQIATLDGEFGPGRRMSSSRLRARTRVAALKLGFGQEIEIRQGAEIGKPSVLYAVATGSEERIESVEVGGVALIVAEGVFRIARS